METSSKDYSGFNWLKVKRHVYDSKKSWEENYHDLEKHHVDEMTFLIDEIRKIARELSTQA